ADRARADICARADPGVSKVAQVLSLGTFMHHRFLALPEIPDARACSNVRPRTQSGKRTNVRARSDARRIHIGMRANNGTILHAHIVQDASRTNLTMRADARLAKQVDARLDHRIRSRRP